MTVREDWDKVSLAVMKNLNMQKFRRGSELAQKLLDTGGAHIEEGNRWGDTFWGTCNGKGQNHLGHIEGKWPLSETRLERSGK